MGHRVQVSSRPDEVDKNFLKLCFYLCNNILDFSVKNRLSRAPSSNLISFVVKSLFLRFNILQLKRIIVDKVLIFEDQFELICDQLKLFYWSTGTTTNIALFWTFGKCASSSNSIGSFGFLVKHSRPPCINFFFW